MRMRTLEGASWMMKKAMTEMDFPLAGSLDGGSHDSPAELDGGFADLGEDTGLRSDAVRMAQGVLQTHGLRAVSVKFLVLVAWDDLRMLEGEPIGRAITVFPVDDQLVRYQRVMYEARFARLQCVCPEGVFYELDAEHVYAWSGGVIGRATSRFLSAKKYFM